MITANYVQIQSVGCCKGKPAGQLQVGDVTIWNFGYTYTFARFVKETKAQVIVELISDADGKVWQKRMGKTRLVAVR